jgi:NAD(P)-dependent dehydrogenase (short-subunit alcohol dehydrogenase family)
LTRNVIITGGTRGIGAGLVKAFARMGWRVVFTGRSGESVRRAVEALAPADAALVSGIPCAADDPAGLAALWRLANSSGRVDAVICNAGVSAPRPDFTENTEEEIRSVIGTNLLGPIMAAKTMVPPLRAQGSGFLYVMEGLGSRGEVQPGLALYGTGKYGLSFFMRALERECRGKGPTLGLLSPGMVVTDLLLAGSGGLAGATNLSTPQKRIFNILADRVDTVAPWLAARVARDVEAGPRGGLKRIAWLTGAKAAYRFMSAPFRKRDVMVTG